MRKSRSKRNWKYIQTTKKLGLLLISSSLCLTHHDHHQQLLVLLGDMHFKQIEKQFGLGTQRWV